jgi:hypothetical protein
MRDSKGGCRLKIGEDGFIYSEMEEKWKIQISLLLYV